MASMHCIDEITPARMAARKKWKLVSNTFRAITLFRTCDTRTMMDINDLIQEVRRSPLKERPKKQITLLEQKIDEHKYHEQLFRYIQNSSKEDLIKISDLIESDPKRYALSPSHPDSLINKQFQDSRPLYEASKLGYPETVKLLLDHGADPHLKSGKNLKETPLEVAARWRHYIVVIILLENTEWNYKELRKALRDTSDKIQELLQNKINTLDRENCQCKVY
ncbi:hypothetical protein SteCoe_1112 [Stentor coeruleus]|uniref:Uncharacterized protein n=1 Tax=Stentor coeruleus TaxID=5963 RepID=A0A1R2D2L7_9CILI|nr:hypothetical protein SteCoe_1112 [Stentor coeruleus]